LGREAQKEEVLEGTATQTAGFPKSFAIRGETRHPFAKDGKREEKQGGKGHWKALSTSPLPNAPLSKTPGEKLSQDTGQ